MRLERYVSQSLSRSRRDCRGLILTGRVTVNGDVVRVPGHQVVQHSDTITLDGEPLRGPGGYRLLMMHKPAGCITATVSDEHEVVMAHVPADLKHPKLFPVGRLDKDTTGLLLFTTDGGLNQLLLHPRRHVEKAYIATLKRPLADGVEAMIEEGVPLSDGTVCLPARLDRIDELTVRLIVTEGRYHQVKRMLGHVGGHVVQLHRERIGPLVLDPALGPGEVREVTPEERDQLVASVGPRSRFSPGNSGLDGGRRPLRKRRKK